MPKNKEQKKKERERRVAQKKLAAAEKRAQDQTTEPNKTFPKKNVFTNAIAAPKTNMIAGNAKKPFNYRRTGG